MEILANDSSLYKNLFLRLSYPALLIEVVDGGLDQYRFYEVNDAACTLLNYSRIELLKNSDAILYGTMWDRLRTGIKAMLLNQEDFSTLFDLQGVNTPPQTVEIHASYVKDGEKALVFCMLKPFAKKSPNQEQLVEENNFLQTIINTTQSVVLIFDKEGHISQWNQFTEKMTGYTLQEMQNKKFWDVFIEREEKERIIVNFKSGKIPSDYENYWILKNGEKRFLKWKSVVVKDKVGDIKYIISTGVDITDQVRSLNLLEKSKEKYKTLVSSMDDLVFTIDRNLKIKSVYGRWLERKGFSTEIFKGKSVTDIFPENMLHSRECMKALAGSSVDFEWTFDFKGRRHYFHSILSPIVLKKNVINEIVGVTRDITDQKVLEEHHRRIYEAVTSGIIVQGDDGKIINANQNACRILGYSERELYQMSSFNKEWDVRNEAGKVVPGEDHPAMVTLRTGKAISNAEISVYNPSKKERRWILADTRPIFSQEVEGKIEYVLSTFHDITDKKEMDHLLKQSEKLAVIGQLASGVAHEIRNPLTGIMGFMKLMEESADSSRLFDYLPIIKQELNQIQQITEEFIELSSSSQDEWKDTDLIHSIRAAISFMKKDFTANMVKTYLDTEGPDTGYFVRGDEDQLIQLFVQLFKNAIDAMPDGGSLKINLSRNGNFVTIKVEDNGKGMSQERLKHLGEPHYSLKEKGTGLGLMRSMKVVQDHLGKITFSSEIGKGTIVTVQFPFSQHYQYPTNR